jgi:hypothetical protein
MKHCVHPLGEPRQARGYAKISEAYLSSQLLERRGSARIPGKDADAVASLQQMPNQGRPNETGCSDDERFQFMASLFIDRASRGRPQAS